MQIEQLSLLPEDDYTIEQENFIIDNDATSYVSCKSNPVDTMVYVYVIFDPITKKRYVGISETPLTRLKTYQRGNGTNTELSAVCKERWDKLSKTVYKEFKDESYTPKDPECRSRIIEAFAINYFDSIENGFNKYLGFHHDYLDTDFWESILPEDLILLYRTSDHHELNKRSLKYVRNQAPYNHGYSTHNLKHKRWAIDYLLKLKDKGVSVQKLAFELCNIDRSNFHRAVNQQMYSSLSARKLYNLVRTIENHLGITPVEYPYFDDIDVD